MSEYYAALALLICAAIVAATVTVGRRLRLVEATALQVFGFVMMALIAMPAAATGLALAFYFATRIVGGV